MRSLIFSLFGWETNETQAIALEKAVLCEDCLHITDSITRVCGFCGGVGISNVQNLLERTKS